MALGASAVRYAARPPALRGACAATFRVSGKPILVTGAHRSGTTWVGKMLALAPGVAYIHEPFNPRTPPVSAPRGSTATSPSSRARTRRATGPGSSRRSAFATASARSCGRCAAPPTSRAPAATRPRSDANRLTGARPLVKDPIALLSAEWLAESFGMDVVVLIRHPAAFAASLKRLGWKHSFATFIQDGEVPEVVRPYEAEIREQAERPGEILAQAALLWRLLYNAVDGYRERHPDWAFVRHEDASRRPRRRPSSSSTGGSGWSLRRPRARRIARASAPDNPAELTTPHAVELDSAASLGRWRDDLTADEVETLRERTRDVWPRFYSDEDW